MLAYEKCYVVVMHSALLHSICTIEVYGGLEWGEEPRAEVQEELRDYGE